MHHDHSHLHRRRFARGSADADQGHRHEDGRGRHRRERGGRRSSRLFDHGELRFGVTQRPDSSFFVQRDSCEIDGEPVTGQYFMIACCP